MTTFLLIYDTSPAATLPANVRYLGWSLEVLLQRLQRTVGVRLRSLGGAGSLLFGRVSAAKVNDLYAAAASSPNAPRLHAWAPRRSASHHA